MLVLQLSFRIYFQFRINYDIQFTYIPRKTEKKRPRGRPRTRWTDRIRKDIDMRGENWEEIQVDKVGE